MSTYYSNLLEEMLSYDPDDYLTRFRVFAAVHEYPSHIWQIAHDAQTTVGITLFHLTDMEFDGLLICHAEEAQEWRLI